MLICFKFPIVCVLSADRKTSRTRAKLIILQKLALEAERSEETFLIFSIF